MGGRCDRGWGNCIRLLLWHYNLTHRQGPPLHSSSDWHNCKMNPSDPLSEAGSCTLFCTTLASVGEIVSTPFWPTTYENVMQSKCCKCRQLLLYLVWVPHAAQILVPSSCVPANKGMTEQCPCSVDEAEGEEVCELRQLQEPCVVQQIQGLHPGHQCFQPPGTSGYGEPPCPLEQLSCQSTRAYSIQNRI